MKRNAKTIFTCNDCGSQSPKWMGKCPDCGGWDTLTETVVRATDRRMAVPIDGGANRPVPLDTVTVDAEYRMPTAIAEFDRVLGGGVVPGSLVLIGGDPGIGKSTLMLQAMHGMAAAGRRVLYVSGEESIRQIRIRSERLEAVDANLLVVSEIDVAVIAKMITTEKPAAVVVDSIQTLFNAELTSAPGSVSQVREATVQLMMLAKSTGTPVFLVGHVTKEGAIAGPRLLEHMVDTVLYFEGDGSHAYRVLRAVKNRFGSTNEIGVFEMNDAGLSQVSNPSEVFLSERPDRAPGSVVTASLEGTRPILVEIQALASATSFGNPRRTILGLDRNRVSLLVAVMEKKLGMQLVGHDIFMNVAGGVKIHEPAVDLAIVASVGSSFLDRPLAENTLVLGEVGLTGEIRAISQAQIRLAEAGKMGFSRCILPEANLKRVTDNAGLTLMGVGHVEAAMDQLF